MIIIKKTTSDDYALDISQADEITFVITVTGDFTLSVENFDAGNVVHLCIAQDGTGSHTVTLSSDFKWIGGSAPTLTTVASSVDIFAFICGPSKLLESSRALDVK